MSPENFLGPMSPAGYPAPYWFIVLFKVLGFTLHLIPMGLWLAGIPLAMFLRWRGGEYGRRLSGRLMTQMPILIALGVNFGIVPLLFVQVAYYRVFYPATILMAWPWLSIILMLTIAYYGVYLYALGLKAQEMRSWRVAIGWLSALLFLVMGFVFTNAFTLMTRLEAWQEIWQRSSEGGASLGVAMNLSDPSVLPRWLMVLGLAIMTTAVYALVDTVFFAKREDEGYRRWATGFSAKTYGVGVLWFAITGAAYVFGTWRPEVREAMGSGTYGILTALTAISPGLPLLLLMFSRGRPSPRSAVAIAVSQFAVLALNAISRQMVQNLELARFLNLTAEPVHLQLSPLIVFLVLFVVGLAVVLWMVRSAVLALSRA